MCGIVGTAGKLNGTTDKQLKMMLILDSVRGIDSTGIAAINRENDVKVVKQLGNPFELMGYKAFDNAIQRLNKVVIGHNRFATQGGVLKKNAHPFDFDSLVGVHNGTLHNKHKLVDSHLFSVDSENLYHHIETEGLRSFLDVAEGAWSLVWWDKVESTLNFLRNKERPMWLAESKNGDFLFWASEAWMLDVAINKELIEFHEPVSTKIDHHYSFHIDNTGKISKPRVREAAAKHQPVVHPGKYGNFQAGQDATPGTNVLPLQQKQESKVVELKKKGVMPSPSKQLALSSPNLYAGRKEVFLECLALKIDRHGARYIVCFDPQMRANQIRLYLRRDDKDNYFLDKDILATVGPKIADGMEGLYYKVEHSTVRLANVALIEKPEETEGKYFYDARGRLLEKKAWLEKFNACAWCTGWVNPEKSNRFTKSDDIICHECAEDSEITKYVEFQ
jgi:hypothetical protein